MPSFSLRFRGLDLDDARRQAEAFFRHGGAELGLDRDEFLARLLPGEDGRSVVFVPEAPVEVPPDGDGPGEEPPDA